MDNELKLTLYFRLYFNAGPAVVPRIIRIIGFEILADTEYFLIIFG